ncbi:MAG: hypothetical protein V8T45_11240 [Oscillospiraceae bacterium]
MKKLNEATQEAMNHNQREYYLREEIKVIQAELGEDDDDKYLPRQDRGPACERRR